MIRHLCILTACAALAACATTTSSHLQQGRADAAAWDALHGVASTLDSMALGGVLHGAPAATARVDLDKASAALKAADAAYQAGSDASAAQNVAVATEFITELVGIANLAKGN